MSIELIPECDECRYLHDAVSSSTSTGGTVAKLRRKLSTQGWTRENGKDICPECSARKFVRPAAGGEEKGESDAR